MRWKHFFCGLLLSGFFVPADSQAQGQLEPVGACNISTHPIISRNDDPQPCTGPIRNASTYGAVRSDPGPAAHPIDMWGACRYVDNNSPTNSVLVPFRTSQEWLAFIANGPAQSSVSLVPCALPWTPPTPTADQNSASSTFCSNAALQSAPAALPFRRSGDAALSASATYSCTCTDGSAWTQTATQFYAPSSSADNADRTNLSGASAGWVLSGSVSYAGAPPEGCNTVPAYCWSNASAGSPLECTVYGECATSGATSAAECWDGTARAATTLTCQNQTLGRCTSPAPPLNACGSAHNGTSANAPTANLCSDGSAPAVTHNSGQWIWSCGSSSCSARVTMPNLRAGCAVAVCLAPNCLSGVRPHDMRSSSCAGAGHSNSNWVQFNVGTRGWSNATAVGMQYGYDFGADKTGPSFGSAEFPDRFTVSWYGDLDPYIVSPGMHDNYYLGYAPVPNGSFTQYVTIRDNYSGEETTLNLQIHKDTEAPVCPTCSAN